MMHYLLLVLLSLWSEVQLKVLPGRGTFKMNGIFPITSPDHINYQSGIMMAEAMRYAVREVQKRTNYLYGYKLGIKDIIDTEDDDIVRKCILDTFTDEVPFLIGPYSSESSYIGSILTRTFGQLAVSYSATYSDFEKTQDYMLRTVPTDKFRVEAAIDVVKKLNWNYIGVISSYGYNGEREALRFIQKLPAIKVCLANQIDLPQRQSEERYMEAILTMNEDKGLKALVLFTTNSDSRLLLSAIQKLGLKGRFYILCIYGCTNYIEVVRGVEDVSNGILSLDIHYPEEEGFKHYFLKLRPTHQSPKYFLQFWEDVFNCTLDIEESETYQPEVSCTAETLRRRRKTYNPENKCTGTEQLEVGRGYYPLTPVNSVISAVYAIADVISGMVERVCNEENLRRVNRTRCYIDVATHIEQMTRYLVKTIPKYEDGTIKFHKSPVNTSVVRYDVYHYQKYRSKLVGTWTRYREDVKIKLKPEFFLHDIWTLLPNGSLIRTHAYCSQECPYGNIKIRDTNIMKGMCCWTCRKCPEQSIALNGTCVRCKDTEKPDHESTTCTPLPRKFISLNNTASWVIFVLSAIGLILVLFVVIIFIQYRNNLIIRSSGRDLCFLILFGIGLSFTCPFLFLIKPSFLSCLFRGALPGIAFTCCYAPLFLRTNRIYRVFFHSKVSVPRPSLASSQSQLLISCGIVAIQMLLVVVWFVSKMPSPEETVAINILYVNLHCKADTSPILLLLNLSLSMIFMISCTILAFKTRRFPKNYNEAKHIGVTLYLSCVSWAVFFPGYFLTNPKTEFLREYLMCAICIAIGYTTLFGLFAPKTRMVFCGAAEEEEEKKPRKWNLSDEDDKSDKRNSEPATDVSTATSPAHQALL